MGHLGAERTLELIRSRFYWPKMSHDVESKIKSCPRCVKRKSQPDKAAPLVNIQTNRPMELVCMDFLSIEPDSHNCKDILVITDHYTKYATAIPTRDQKALTVAKCLWEQFFVHYGFPERLHSDQGRDFESQVVKELCALVGTKKVRTSPYHPRGNPVERYNRTLLSMLGTLKDKEKSRWREYVRPLTHAYNCTRSDVTGFSPYELMFGRQPRLPIDIAFGLPVKNNPGMSHSQYVRNLKTYLKESYQLASANAKKIADKNKRRFDMRVRESTLDIGDRVLVRNLRFRGKHKLADRWEFTIYVVKKKAGDMPVYTVCPEGQEGPLRTLHRDLLLPCGFLSEEDEEMAKPKQPSKPKTRQTLVSPEENTPDSDIDDDYIQSYYPTTIETTTRIIKPNNVNSNPSATKENLTNVEESENLPMDLPSKILDQPVEKQRTNQNGNLPDATQSENLNEPLMDVTQNELEPENEQENGPTEMEHDLPDNSSHTKTPERVEQSKDTEQRQSNEMDNAEQNASSLELADPDVPNNQTADQLRRSERLRKPPVKFTYPQLGKPLISFAQTIIDGFNKALVETFEGAPTLVRT
uniref:Gypsy retrotransposon integrase-like protein 1 n=1 Tax=Neogobius melanostomus TaxID=47308 RepID=A0A8C6WVQ7_9GOBI